MERAEEAKILRLGDAIRHLILFNKNDTTETKWRRWQALLLVIVGIPYVIFKLRIYNTSSASIPIFNNIEMAGIIFIFITAVLHLAILCSYRIRSRNIFCYAQWILPNLTLIIHSIVPYVFIGCDSSSWIMTDPKTGGVIINDDFNFGTCFNSKTWSYILSISGIVWQFVSLIFGINAGILSAVLSARKLMPDIPFRKILVLISLIFIPIQFSLFLLPAQLLTFLSPMITFGVFLYIFAPFVLLIKWQFSMLLMSIIRISLIVTAIVISLIVPYLKGLMEILIRNYMNTIIETCIGFIYQRTLMVLALTALITSMFEQKKVPSGGYINLSGIVTE